jgi:hypothetical protein
MNPAKLQPALLAGVAIGVLSALPVISIGNLCCCAWVVMGGMLASYLMQQNHPLPINVGDGALVGLLAGVVGAVVSGILTVPLTLAMGPFQAEMFERVLESVRDTPPEARSILEGLSGGTAVGIGMLVFSFFVALFAGCVFGLIGGVLGALFFKKNAAELPPPPPPPVPTF